MADWEFKGFEDADGPTADLRMDRPTAARMYDYALGGKDHFNVDRDAVERAKDVIGESFTSAALENRSFLQRAVAYLSGAGIDQFIDLGSGLPAQGNVHEVAQRANPDARVLYIDNDPIVLAHGRALLADDKTTRVVTADLRDPGAILRDPDVVSLIDLTRPVAVLFIAVLHFIGDGEDPYGIVTAFRDAMAPGSYLAISHVTSDGPDPGLLAHAESVYGNSASPFVPRTRERIGRFFDGLDLVDPGLVRPWQWHPGPDNGPATDWMYAGVAKTQQARQPASPAAAEPAVEPRDRSM